jgi:hypothetical protein
MLVDRALKRFVDLRQAVLENFGEADQDGERDPAQQQRIDQFLQVDGALGFLGGMNQKVSPGG